jgi:hypothetical protein
MNKWENTETSVWLFTVEEFDKLPDGIELECINGSRVVKGKDYIDMGTRFGYIAYGVRDPLNHLESELFLTFRLSQ